MKDFETNISDSDEFTTETRQKTIRTVSEWAEIFGTDVNTLKGAISSAYRKILEGDEQYQKYKIGRPNDKRRRENEIKQEHRRESSSQGVVSITMSAIFAESVRNLLKKPTEQKREGLTITPLGKPFRTINNAEYLRIVDVIIGEHPEWFCQANYSRYGKKKALIPDFLDDFKRAVETKIPDQLAKRGKRYL